MECAEWVYTDGINPNYLQGRVLEPGHQHLCANTIVAARLASDNDTCAACLPDGG